MIFVEKEAGIIDEELPHAIAGVVEDKAARPAAIAEEKATLVLAPVARLRLAVVVGERAIVEATARVVVDQIEENGDSMQMAEINEAFELIGAGSDICEGDRRGAARLKERIDNR